MLEKMRQNASGWIVKILFGIIIVVFVFAFGMSSFDNSGDPILAYVDDEPITRLEFEENFQRTAENVRRGNPNITPAQLQSPEFKRMVLDELVTSRLLQGEAKSLGIGVSEKELFAAITREPAFWNAKGEFDRSIYTAKLHQLRMNPAQFEAMFKQDMIATKLRRYVARAAEVAPEQARQRFDWAAMRAVVDYVEFKPESYAAKVKPTDEDVLAFYEKRQDVFTVPARANFKYIAFTPDALAPFQKVTDQEIEAFYKANLESLKEKEQVKARHILIAVDEDASDAKVAEAKRKIESVLKQARAGKDFGKLAAKYSEGPSAPSGGDLGWFGKGMMVRKFEKAAFKLGKNQISNPVRTRFGWHIIKVEDRKEAGVPTLAEVRDKVRRDVAEEKAAEKISDLLDAAMDRLVSGMDIQQVATELDLVARTTPELPEADLQKSFGLTPEAAQVLFDLPDGKAHNTPLSINGGYLLAAKVKSVPSTVLPLEKVKDSVLKAVTAEQAMSLAQKDAEVMLAKLSGADADAAAKEYASRIRTSEPFSRQGFIPGLGMNPKLAEAALAAQAGSWLATPFQMQTGVVIVRLNKTILPTDDEWKQAEPSLMASANQAMQMELLNAYMTELRAKADINIVRPDLLN